MARLMGWLNFWQRENTPARQAIGFPNQSRSFDATRNGVRFWGNDNALEAAFFISGEALLRLEPSLVSDESGMLHVFDAHRTRVLAAAAVIYSRGYKGVYDIGASNI